MSLFSSTTSAPLEVVSPRYVDYTPANSVYSAFPAMMTDNRSLPLTSSISTAERAQLINKQKFTSNWEYRAALTLRGAEMMQADFQKACAQAGYVSTTDQLDTSQRLATTTDLKQLYLSREQLNAQRAVSSFEIE